jgi:CheY-like chemotaxis protein
VDTARDGVEALEMIRRRDYAIAIIDLMMPRLSGYDLVQEVGTLEKRPVIIVATALTNSDVLKIDDTLVRSVIRKPFDVKAVAEALVDTAKYVVAKQAGVDTPLPIAPPGAAMISVIEEDDTIREKKKDDRPAATDEVDRPSC